MNEDLIRRRDAIDKLKSILRGGRDCEMTEEAKENCAVKFFEGVPSVSNWTPCSERLPEAGVCVLITIASDYDRSPRIEIGRWSEDMVERYGEGWEWLNESGAEYWESVWGGNEVTAWMQLPEPYKEDEA